MGWVAPGGTDQAATVHAIDPEKPLQLLPRSPLLPLPRRHPRDRRKCGFSGQWDRFEHGRYWPLRRGSRQSTHPAILGLLVLLSLLYLGKVEAEQRKALREEVAAEGSNPLPQRARRRRRATRGGAGRLVERACASGWQEMIVPYLTESAVDEIEATLDDLILPKSIKAISLDDLQLGPRPPLIRSLAAAPAPSLSRPTANGGCVAQLEIEWEAPDAYASLAFRLANVQSQPRLRLRRARLRGTVRVHFEWLRGYPYVGCVRFTFVKPPEISDFALEPLGNIDVTVLPGIGSWIRALVASALKFATMPNWVETDMRAPSRVPKKELASCGA